MEDGGATTKAAEEVQKTMDVAAYFCGTDSDWYARLQARLTRLR